MPELKPCPFCGGKAKIHKSAKSTVKGGLWYFVNCQGHKCKVYPQTYTYSKKSYAINAWNRRAQ